MYAIVAVDEKWGIGRNNDLLFHISADLKRFRALTEGGTVLMGRKTLESLPGGKGLPRRRNLVLTSQRGYAPENAEPVHSPAEAILTAGAEAWVIGGASVYRTFLPLCDRVYVTRIAADGDADTFFPDLSADPRWRLTARSEEQEENGIRFRYEEYTPAPTGADPLASLCEGGVTAQP